MRVQDRDRVIRPTNIPAMDLTTAKAKVAVVNDREKMPVKERVNAAFL